MTRMARAPWVIAAMAATVISPSIARADESPQRCLAAYEASQKATDQGDLLDAQQKLIACAGNGCPLVLQRECVQAAAAVTQRLPTLVAIAHGPNGDDLSDVALLVDGRLEKSVMDGREVALNPGAHTLRFRRTGGEVIERRVVLAEREKGRVVAVTFGASAALPPASADAARPTPPLFWVLAGVGVASAVSFAGFGLAGKSAYDDLDACAPNCPSRDVTTVKQRFFVADVSLIVAALAFGGAAYVWLSRPAASSP